MNTKSKKNLLRISLSAMFLALAIISDLFISIDIPLFGIKGKELSPAGIFTSFPAMIFGPIYGGIVSGLTDLLSYIFKPQGAYIPWLTIMAFLGGFIKGLIWFAIKNVKNKRLRTYAIVILIVIGAIGVFNHITILNDGITDKVVSSESSVLDKGSIDSLIEENKISKASYAAYTLTKYSKSANFKIDLAKYINVLTIAFESIALLGLVLVAIDYLLERKENIKENPLHASYMKVLIVLLIPSIIVTTLNTQILIWVISVFNDRAFLIMWVPRIIPGIISTTIQAYFVAFLYDVYLRNIKNKMQL